MKKLIIYFSALFIVVASTAIVLVGKENNGLLINSNIVKNALELKAKCLKDSTCYQNSLILYMSKNGVPATVKLVSDTSKITDGLYNECHNISHRLGQEAFKLINKEALSLHENSCQWGFGHGVLIAASDKLPAEEFVDAFKDFCAVDPEPIGCLHGIGHALGSKGTEAKLSQEICYTIGKDIDGRKTRDIVSKSSSGACVEGWMMQQLGSLPYNSFKEFQQVIEPCDNMTSEAKNICNGMSIRNYVDIGIDIGAKNRRLSEFKKYCDKVKDSMEGYECGRYLAEAVDDVIVPGNEFNNIQVAKAVDYFCDTRWSEACTTSFTNYQINRNESNPKNMLKVCKILKTKLAEICYKSISNRTNQSIEQLKSLN